MSDNPFAEPDDDDRTILHLPSLASTMPMPTAAPEPVGEAALALAGEEEALPLVGLSPLAAAAAPLLALLAGLVPGRVAPEAEDLRQRAIHAVRRFEADAREAGIAAPQLRAAHYLLCAALDDVVLATPWGQGSSWAAHSLVSTFHQEVRSGERFFDLVTGMQREPGRYLQALEIAYLCLSLGMQGRYRLERNGPAALTRIREALFELVSRLRGPWERELSPHWRGVDAPHRPERRHVPAWTALPVVLGLLGLGYAAFSFALNGQSDRVFHVLAGLPPTELPTLSRAAPPVPPAPAPARPDPAQRLRVFLEPEIREGLVEVSGDARRILVRITGSGMFASASATLVDGFRPLMQRIGTALRDQPGAVLVTGHSDNQPIRSMRFPSNFQLSAARAAAALAAIAAAEGGSPQRFRAEGRGDAEPIADNATPAGRERNRRIDVTVLLEEPRP
jgi:type VI secretion system protein ImpK